MDQLRQTFEKSERLSSLKIISGLFENGNVFYTPLFKVVWSESPVPLSHPAQAAFSVTKRGFRHAVTRNLVKRRMREAYRRQKQRLYDHLSASERHIVFMIIMRGNVIHDYATIERAVNTVILKLISFTPGSNLQC